MKFPIIIPKASSIVLFIILTLLVLWGVTAGGVEAKAPAQTQEAVPYTFIETTCTFIDTSELLFLSTPPDELGYKCGYVVVPLRHSDPDGETIQLPVAILPASEPGAGSDPLFVVQGGPGGSAFEIYPFLLPDSSIASQRDIVMINQRGTQFAQPELLCPETIDGLADVLNLPEDEGLNIIFEQVRACRERLLSRGIDLSAFNSMENANDIEAIRRVLGYEDYNFYGVSYGSLLGLHLMRQHPEHLRSVILDGVLPADLSFIRQVPQSENRAFQELFDACAQDPICAADYPNLEARLVDLVEALDENPATLRLRDAETNEVIKARLDGNVLIDLLFESFYLEHPYAILPRVITDAETGDFTFLESIGSLIAFTRSFSEGMYYSVICSEEWQDDQAGPPLEGLKPYLTRNVEVEIQSYRELCNVWDVEPLPEIANQPVSSDIPTLLLSGHFDPITPPSFAAQAAETLSMPYQVVDPYGSHGIAFMDACVNQIIGDFLNDPESMPDTGCLDSGERRLGVVPPSAVSAPFLVPLAQFEPEFLTVTAISAGLVLLISSAFLIWPLAWLIRVIRQRQLTLDRRQKRMRWAGRIIILSFTLLAALFGIAMLVFVIRVTVTNLAFLSVYALPASARPFLLIPFFLIVLCAGAFVVAVNHWRNPTGPLWERIYYSILTGLAIVFVVLIATQGFLVV